MGAGIPNRVAADYAVTFSDNRMRLDMLPDLSKDYLRDMGITLMGDVIAILKHAKLVSQQVRKVTVVRCCGVMGSERKTEMFRVKT